MSFQAVISKALAQIQVFLQPIEALFSPIAQQALDLGINDLAGDAAQIAAQIAADPTIVSSADKREAATQALLAELRSQGVALEEHSVAAAAAAALAKVSPVANAAAPKAVNQVEPAAEQPPAAQEPAAQEQQEPAAANDGGETDHPQAQS